MNRRVYLVLVVALIFQDCALVSPQHDQLTRPSAKLSNANVNGTYVMTATLKPYVKFGGPQVASGKLKFDGQGNVSGHVTSFGVPADLKGTYEVDSDGAGTIQYTATTQSGQVTNGQTRLRVISPNEIEFEPIASANRDWESAATTTRSGNNPMQGKLRKIAE